MKPINLRHEKRKSHWYGIFVCQCGKEHVASVYSVKSGKTKSCGCGPKTNFKHGLTYSPTWGAWRSMRKRCLDKNHPSFASYGARGISICKEWRDSFQNFLSDMGERPHGTTLDRIDNDKGYEPGNCRWASAEVQSNNKRNNRKFEMNGKNQTVDQWARELGLNRDSIWIRLKHNKPFEQAIKEVKERQEKGIIKCKMKNQLQNFGSQQKNPAQSKQELMPAE